MKRADRQRYATAPRAIGATDDMTHTRMDTA
jgi:hypothetical protein